MGNYNSQYQAYYTGMSKKNNTSYPTYYSSNNNYNNVNENKILKRIIRELIGTLILFTIIIGCKLIVTPQTQIVYNYGKTLVNQNYDYKPIVEKISSLKLVDMQNYILDTIEEVKSKVNGGKTFKQKLKEDFSLPVQGSITSFYGKERENNLGKKQTNYGVDIAVQENTGVKSSYMGRVKECAEDKELGKFIVIDHGDGIETKYGNLKEILIKKEDMVEKGEIIGKSGNIGKAEGAGIHFEISYMGENLDPQKYINFKN